MSGGLSRKLRELDDFLLSGAVGDDAMLRSELDGFLAGLILCPDTIMPSEWMEVIWGGEAPVFDDIGQAQAVSKLILGHYNAIIRDLDREHYRPIYAFDIDGAVLWEYWIEGFVEAMRLRPDAWLDWTQDDDKELLRAWFVLGRLGELATRPHEFEPMDLDKELENLAPDLIPEHVEIMHHARLAEAGQAAHPASQNKRKVGRNEPCPCGSCKKFKKCCLN